MELWPTDTEQPPAFPMAAFYDKPAGQGRACIFRHGKKVNIVYMDGSVRDVKLKELWDQKWHKDYDLKKIATITWPDWLKQ
jgi:prepilin-type processing-associated H-X9-DG protein